MAPKVPKAPKAPRKAATKAAAKNKALIASDDVGDESKNESKITDHFKVKFKHLTPNTFIS